MGSCAAPSAKGDDKFITTDYLQQCPPERVNPFRKVRRDVFNSMRIPLFKVWLLTEFENRFKLNYWFIHLQ
ncbi:hypothetical protein C4674_15900 [Salmonella enterica subsp. enterica serovar Kentucky]|nr:hypothetical protein C4674_15900 [Salmonella enterica subsp. enterica serovar Kentucky]